MTAENVNQPKGDVRQEVIGNAATMLEAMKSKIDATQRQRVLDLVRNEKLSAESLQNIDAMLDRAQQVYATNPQKALEIMNTMIRVGADGEVSHGDMMKVLGGAGAAAPESLQKIGGMVDKLSASMNGLGDQMSGLGSGTMKMLEGMFGPDSFFGKVFAYLKNTPKAQIAYIEKKLLEQQKTLSPNSDPQQIVNVLRAQILQAQNIERRAKRAPTYDIVQHVEQLMAQINPSKTELSLDDFRTAGEKVLKDYTAEVSALPPQAEAPAAAQAAERARKEVKPSVETAISKNDATPMMVSKETDGVKFSIASKNATLKKVGDTTIASAEVLEPTATQPAAVILTLTDNKKVQIEATELKSAATDGNKKIVTAKNLTSGSDMSLEIQFS